MAGTLPLADRTIAEDGELLRRREVSSRDLVVACLARIARETMTSERVYPPIARDAPGGYYLEGVLFTQYFSRSGAAIHYNYWSSNWGYAGSHGCLGLPLAEAKWAWDWSRTGTPVKVFA